MALTPHDEDLVKLSELEPDDENIEYVSDMQNFRMDPTIALSPTGKSAFGMGADAQPSALSLKNVIVGGLLLVGGWMLYKKLRRK